MRIHFQKNLPAGFTTKRDERRGNVFILSSEASAGRKAVRGFTLIEALIAVTILSLAVAGPLMTASRAIVAAQTSRDQLTASYLAQEGVEYVRALRDGIFLSLYAGGGSNLSQTAWSEFLNAFAPCIGGANAWCTLDPSQSLGVGSGSAFEACSLGTCTPLYLTGTGYNQRGIGTQTRFTRSIHAEYVSDTDERIVSKVQWSFHGIPYTVTVVDHLSPWQ